jgi:hypothetical protein
MGNKEKRGKRAGFYSSIGIQGLLSVDMAKDSTCTMVDFDDGTRIM